MSKGACIGKGVYTNVDALLDAFHQGAAEANLQQYFGCFHPDGRFLGTDATENWHVNAFFDWSLPHFKAGEGWIFRPIRGSRKVTYYPNESTPSFCAFDELVESHQFVATSRGSGSLVFDSDKRTWLVAQYHLSFPIPNDLAVHITKKISLFESSTKQETAAAEAARQLMDEWDLEDKKAAPAPGRKKKGGGKSKK
ncbi:hypothetical protein DYB25_002757 [Aphanomyces astaci]|uniref:SnoaL-like domain-containing protein n=1 Tax=Aphanomyces astaci TaxID=112090 RepID=A0A397ATL5_APHAT|nr:hypothetical protein DYB25_002757 [Aphanomyces astaci]RHY10256.1 hypothetical protein DYB36_000677 [Aphanomyces astaci]RHY51949.1 hypothetical protein DYB30_005883 [Aphanomyces astaci]RHY59642.1 hypothetical protein DYB34_001947 [Aphanomyces astaci]RHY63051.1 hypothetical protein DYB38_002725 [Aphanomyces astaci]